MDRLISKPLENELEDLGHVVEQHYDSSPDESSAEALWHQQKVLLLIARQLAEINVHLEHIAAMQSL